MRKRIARNYNFEIRRKGEGEGAGPIRQSSIEICRSTRGFRIRRLKPGEGESGSHLDPDRAVARIFSTRSIGARAGTSWTDSIPVFVCARARESS
jgi:hypothetical protein